MNDIIWDEILTREGQIFTDHRGKSFSYHIKRDKAGTRQGEIVIDGRHKSITRATVLLAYHRMLELKEQKGDVSNHRKLGAYGSEYLLPIFREIVAGKGICEAAEFSYDDEQSLETGRKAESQSPESTERVCRNCGYSTSEDFEFCPKCGTRFAIGDQSE